MRSLIRIQKKSNRRLFGKIPVSVMFLNIKKASKPKKFVLECLGSFSEFFDMV